MVSGAVLGAALGAGLALAVALTLIIYHYNKSRRKDWSWGPIVPCSSRHSTISIPPSGLGRPASPVPSTSKGMATTTRRSYGNQQMWGVEEGGGSSSQSHSTMMGSSNTGGGGLCSRNSSTKSCPPLVMFPHQEFNVASSQRIVQPNLNSVFSSLPEVRENNNSGGPYYHHPPPHHYSHPPPQDNYYFQEEEEEEIMLTHQSRSLPQQPGNVMMVMRLNRAPSVSHHQHPHPPPARKGHRGSSPAIRTFTPEGLVAIAPEEVEGESSSPPDSPPITYHGSRSPSPITNIRGMSCSSLDKGGNSPSSSNLDLRPTSPGDIKGSSLTSLNSLVDHHHNKGVGDPSSTAFRRSSRCLSPLLIPPRSPTLSEGSLNPVTSPAVPLSPLLGTLRLDLYKKQDVKIRLPGSKQAEPSLSSSSPLGQLHFNLKYDFDKSDLTVHVVEAHNLAVSNQGGFNDPYVRLFLSPEVDGRKRQTSIHRNEQNPYFDEVFKFPVSQDEMKERVLILQVYDYDRYSRNDVVGQVSFSLDEFEVTTNLEIWADVIKNKKPSGERQEILVSLSYLPSAERLTVVVLKARNLYSLPNKESLDPFVKVYLTGGGKRLKKKKTTGRKNTKNPVWNEAVSFSISASSLANASLEVCVLDQSNDLMGSNALIGSCVLGNTEDGHELTHWQEMTQNFRKSIAMWHVLT